MKATPLALLALLLACADPPAPEVVLYGERLTLPTARWYDDERLPVVRGPLPTDASFVLELEQPTSLPITRREVRDGVGLAWLGPPSPPPTPGAGWLTLKVGDHEVTRWRVEWRLPPARWPELAAITQPAGAGRPADALAATEAVLANPAPAAVHHFARVERARLFQRLGRTREAVAAWQVAAQSALDLPSLGEAARCLRAGAFSAFVGHHATLAEALLDEAEGLSPQPWEAARRALQRGQLHLFLGELAPAADDLRVAIDTSYATGADADHAAAVMALGTLLVKLGDHPGARALLERARPFFSPPRASPFDQASFLGNLAYAVMTDPQGDLAVAEQALQQAQALYRSLGDREREAFCEVKLANIAFRLGRPQEARTRATEARRLAPDGVDLQEGPLLLLEVDLATTPAEAEERIEAALAWARTTVDPELAWQAWHARSRRQQAQGDLAGARRSIEQAIEIMEEIGRTTSVVEGRATYFADREGPVQDAVALLLQLGDTAAAFAVADAARSRVARGLEGQARVGRLSPAARQRYAADLGAWQARRQAFERDALRGRRLVGEALAAFEAERTREADALATAFAALQRQLDAEAPTTAPTGRTARELQAALEADAALLLFTPQGRHWRAFYVDPGRLEVRDVHPDQPLAAWADRLADRRRLYVVPGGLEAARHLHQRTHLPVGYLPSAGLLRPVVPVAGEVLIIADPTSDLPHARAEGQTLARSLPGAHLLVGEAAHLEAVRTALPRARVIHFAGHGALDPTSPWEAHLRLAGGGRLTLRDVLALPLRAERVVLSGCETAGTRAVGPEHLGLAEAFVLAGAQTVVAAEEKIDDAATADWMARWYAAPGSPGEALVAVGGAGFRLIGRP